MASPMMTGSRKVELWGNRPSTLSIQSESKKIQKGSKKPVIIYVVSPKVIHVEASEFMTLVQQLTGLASSSAADNGSEVDVDAGNHRRTFPVKVKARVLGRQGGVESDKLSVTASVFRDDAKYRACEGVEEGDLIESENWFKWSEY